MIIQKKLPNGITLVAEPLNNFRSVTIGVWVGAGSVIETPEENGISHFIEHMLFKGTKKRSAKQIAIDVDNIGGQINAFTSKEYTCYYIKAMDAKLQDAVEILFDLFCNATLDATELEKEKGVVCEEIAMSNDNPEDLAMDLITSEFFAGCALEKTILGPTENIRRFTRDDLLSYMRRYYCAENIVVAVAGNFDMDKLETWIDQYFDGFHGETLHIPEFSACSGFEAGRHFANVERDIEQVHLCFGLPSVDVFDEQKYALNVVNNVVGGSMSSRLFQKIREEMGMAYAVFSYPVIHKCAGMYGVYAGTMAENATVVTEMILKELAVVHKQGISKEEFLQSKEQLKGNLVLSLESTSSKMSAIGKAYVLTKRVQEDEEVLAKIDAVTMEDVDALIAQVYDLSKLTMTSVGTLSEPEKIQEMLETCKGA